MASHEFWVSLQVVVFDLASIVLTATAGVRIVGHIWSGRGRKR
jgi:hypothetical protein